MNKPEFITFTGIDEDTKIEDLKALATEYPIEWGILLSNQRQGDSLHLRFPPEYVIERFAEAGLYLAAHLCGNYARQVIDGVYHHLPKIVFANAVKRVQINYSRPVAAATLLPFQNAIGKPVISQHRDDMIFPESDDIQWLYDRSGGVGIVSKKWPQHPGGKRLVGYAGGIGPRNVLEMCERVTSGRYWIDMETSVRATVGDDVFMVSKCREVCETVFGRGGRIRTDENAGIKTPCLEPLGDAPKTGESE